MRQVRVAAAVLIVVVLAAINVTAAATYHGNTDSKIFHKSSCRYYNCKHCTKEFDNREEAIRAGYRPCKVCKP